MIQNKDKNHVFLGRLTFVFKFEDSGEETKLINTLKGKTINNSRFDNHNNNLPGAVILFGKEAFRILLER